MISVLLTTSGQRSNLLEASLGGLAIQTYPSFEVVVVEDGDDGGATRKLAEAYRVRYVQLIRSAAQWNNPALPFNIGFRQARGEYIVHQCGDTCFTRSTDLENLLLSNRRDDRIVTIASCRKLKQDGRPGAWQVHPTENPQHIFASGSCFRTDFIISLGGFDERFVGWGYEDEDLMWRMKYAGAQVEILSYVCSAHLWHPPSNVHSVPNDRVLFEQNKADILAGRRGPAANEGHDWGRL